MRNAYNVFLTMTMKYSMTEEADSPLEAQIQAQSRLDTTTPAEMNMQIEVHKRLELPAIGEEFEE